MIITGQFTVAKTWKQSNAMECYSAIKKDEILPFAATWIDLEIITGSEVRQSHRHRKQTCLPKGEET